MRFSKSSLFLAFSVVVALSTPASALDIALTNDDGWNAMGIQAMKSALEAAGHTVTLAAPLTDQSGSSMALDMEPLAVKKQGENQYSVALFRDPTISAKPANSGLVAIGIVQEKGHSPDLLISGINTSPNLGMTALLSGTVGAAVHGSASVLNGPVPSIAVGTEEPACDVACKQAHYEVVADFVVRFVAHLQQKPGFLASEPGLLPAGMGLVISYPKTDAVTGMKVATLSNAALLNGQRFTGAFMCAGTGCSVLATGQTQRSRMVPQSDPTPEVKDADVGYFIEGFVTIVPVVPNISLANPLVFKSVLAGFNP